MTAMAKRATTPSWHAVRTYDSVSICLENKQDARELCVQSVSSSCKADELADCHHDRRSGRCAGQGRGLYIRLWCWQGIAFIGVNAVVGKAVVRRCAGSYPVLRWNPTRSSTPDSTAETYCVS